MSSATKRRARSQIETGNDADVARYGDFDILSPAASEGSKRMRLRGGRGDTSHLELDEEDDQASGDDFHSFAANDDDDDVDASPPRTNGPASTNGASLTDFSPGAIVRVTIENFVTYERADFFPGPSLNMVIGPNGVGKSSLVCAICLGLGYPPAVLGRAGTVGEFVKHGKDHAIVELELQKRPQDRANYVIRLRINAENNERNFSMNGKSCTLKNIKSVMAKLRIQIDNLCQFLPQDKVAEFAGLEPIEKLNKTLMAAAPEEVVQQQQELKQMFSEQKELQRNLDTGAESLRSLQVRQQGLQADVERLKEREQIQKAVNDLSDARLIVHYNEERARYMQVKEEKKKAEQRHRRLEQENQPALENVNAKQTYKHEVERALKARIRQAQLTEAEADKSLHAVEKVKEDMQSLENKKILERESMDKKKKEVGQYRTKITQLEGQMESGKDIDTRFNAKEWSHKIRECAARVRDLEGKSRELENTRQEIRQRGTTKSTEARSIKQELESLNSQEGQKLAQLRRLDPEVARAYDWLQEHRSEFEKEVFGPAFLNCSMKDKRYSDHVQSGLQKDDLFCFTAQTRNDHRKLTDRLFNKLNAAVPIRTILADLSSFHPPLPKDHLSDLGIDGFALDFVEGPSPVLAMLCSEKKLHLTGVALSDINDEQFQRLSDGEKINSFATGKIYHRITRRREYGPGATSTITKNIQRGRWWTDEPVDTAAKAELEQRFRALQQEIAEIRQEFETVKAEQEEVDEQVTEAKQEKDKLEEDKATLQREHTKWSRLPDEIDKVKRNLQRARDDLEEARKRLLKYDDQIDEVALEQAKLVLQHHRSLRALKEANCAVLEAQTRQIEASSDLDALKERSSGIARMLDEERSKVNELDRQLKLVKEEAQRAQRAAIGPLTNEEGETDQERLDLLRELADGQTMDSITGDIESEKAKLELIHHADPGVLRDFEDRARKIERAQAEMATRQASLIQLEERIQELRAKWEPALDDIIRRINDAFSYNFEQINCAGEVGVHKDEDFEKWAIEIKVKFRENETLQVLDQHRQSGGERAVSTIFYLMSLQAMAQSPFRVVDEINQGMDPRNERMVHERMVEIACHEHTSQYFLITPKLLGGLRYDERMKVLCVVGGEHMPREGGKMDLSKVVKLKKRLMASVGT
ncbi:Structural maintenance of chromosomes protein 5 [Gnomoniopsis smithogilvyi]|uniref:Structural maintenance of chromosomes protein 5 n=1 Tax=Gnomoniopsis smithogilvyi TaxID=1191159 RepID=A0A9W8YK72_9PEZI|nr:Structural maintenance of chromosomes protein 5 [Gnomoniopsis smithogilvyi]